MAVKRGASRAASYFHISDNLYIKFDNNDKKGNLGNQWQSLISSPLLAAVDKGLIEVCELLLAAGGDVEERIYPTLFTPLHKAAINGHENNLILTQWRTVCQNCLIRTLPCSCLSPFLQASWRSSSKRLSILAASAALRQN